MANNARILFSTQRNGFVDCSYYGSIFLANSKEIYKELGLSSENIFFMRSLAKPIQTSIIADYNIISDYNLTNEELAIFCASHAGSPLHFEIIKQTAKRFSLELDDYVLEAQKPLDEREYKGTPHKFYNNCSGKHTMMLVMCKYLNLDFKNYTKENHPLQQLIHKKQNELSGFNSNILSYDGCGTPLWGLSAKDIIKTYFNFFHQDKYKPIIKAILDNPYIFGGYDRFDTEIIELGKKNLFSKVGAGGFVLVYNFKKDEILLVKLTQNNNPIRKLITLDILNKLGWINIDIEKFEYNQHKEVVAKYCYEFSI